MSGISGRGLIGVLTFHRCINYGSYWQARCLVEGIRSRGFEAELIDYHSPRADRAEWRCALQPTLPTPVPPSDRPHYRAKIDSFQSAFCALPRSRRFYLRDPVAIDTMQAYDAVVVGSDEVWNLCHAWYGGEPLFYGAGIRAPRKIAYAASFGNFVPEWPLGAPWSDWLREFDDISVRDENARNIVRDSIGRDPVIALDPCLQFPLEPEGSLPDRLGPFIAVYGHNFTDSFNRNVRGVAERRGLPLVSVGYRNDWADEQWLTAGPLEFAHFMRSADAVATNFFHGCVFALRFERPFACEVTPYRSVKVTCLMESLGGLRHLASDSTPGDHYQSILVEPLDPAILSRIEELRHESSAYLDRALA